MALGTRIRKLLPLVIAPVFLFFPLFLGRIVGNRDWPRWAWPSRALWRAAISGGDLPQWNPFVGLGTPVLAAPVHGTFYPGHILLFLGPPVFAVALTWLLHVMVAGLGGYAVARKLGCRPAVAVAAGLAWEMGGYAVSMWGNGEKVLSGAWVPWAAYGLLVLAQSERWARPLCGTALAFALVALAGDPFLWLHALVLGAALSVGSSAEALGLGKAALRLLIRGLPALGLGALLAAAALVPAFSLLGIGERAAGLARDLAEHWSFQPSRIPDLFQPRVLVEGSDVWSLSVYVGGATLALALFARRSAVTLLLWMVAALGLAAALGSHGPVHAVLRCLIPPLRYMRYPEKHLLMTVGALSWLAALGVEQLLSSSPARRRKLLLVFALPLFFPILGGRIPELTHVAVVTAASLVFIGFWRRHGGNHPGLVWSWPILVGFDLLLAAMPVMHWEDARLLQPPALPGAQVGAWAPRLYHAPATGPDLRTLVDNVAAPWGIAHVPGHEATQPANTHRLWDAVTTRPDRALDLFDIGWVVLPKPSAPLGANPAADLGTALLFRREVSARARVTGKVAVADDGHALMSISGHDFDPSVLAMVAPGPHARALDGQGRGRCSLLNATRESLRLTCDVQEGEALAVLADAYVPGWHATVDGQPAEIVRANLAMRGVYLQPGHHALEFRFRTPGLVLGISLSLLGLLLVGILMVTRPRIRVASLPNSGL